MVQQEVKCVIFDCDGTLIDSERLCCQALVNVFSDFDADLSIEESLTHFQGGKLADILSETQNRLGLSISLDILEPLYREEVESLFLRHLQPMNGAFELIQYLKNENIEFCIASNAPKSRIESSLLMTGLFDHFKGKIFSAFDANSWKPEPDLILYTAMNMGFLPSDCIYVDDTKKGIEAGIRAGIKTFCLKTFNIADKTKVETHNASTLNIYSLNELTAWINDKHYLSNASRSEVVG
ncbi:MAG: HAD-IA family hydrolase [Vibrio gallaecicus]